MSQHDMDIATGDANTGATMRIAINAAIQALASTNSGATEPSTMYAFQMWTDTANDLLKIRNAANNAWITIGTLSATNLGLLGEKGADVVSEAALFTTASFPTDGDYFDVTGTTSITSIITSGQVGKEVTLHFDGVLTLTHHATDLILPYGLNITTMAGDEITFREYATGDWRLTGQSRPSTSVIVLDRDVTETEVVNTTTETTVYSFSVPANTLSTNRGLRLTLLGDHLNNSGSTTTPIVKVKYGATTIATLTPASTFAINAGRAHVVLSAILQAKNSASAQVAYSVLHCDDGGGQTMDGSDSTSIYNAENVLSMHNAVAEDSTGALTLSVTYQHGDAHANISFKAFTAMLELLP